MKNLKSVLLLALVAISINASAAQYVVIKTRLFGGYKLVYVSQPKNVKKWYYDSKSDTYYRGKTGIGIPVKVIASAEAK